MPLPLLSLALAAAAADVRLSGERWTELRGPEEPLAPKPPGLLGVTSRAVRLEPTADGALRVHATWRVLAQGPSPVELVLSATPGLHVEAATVDGRTAAVTTTDAGLVWAGTPGAPFTLALTATLPAGGHPERAVLDLLPAGAGTIALPSDWTLADAAFLAPGELAGAPRTLRLAPAVRAPTRGRLVLGEVGLGLTFGEEDLLIRGRLRWRVAGGSVSSVAFTLPGAGPDLQVSGPQVATWSRAGDLVRVDLLGEERGLVDLRVSTRAPLPTGEAATVAVPAVTLDDVFRTSTSVELARDGTLDLVPHLALPPVARSVVPGWGEGLVEGTPTAAFVGQGAGGTVEVLRFTPAEAPATLVDVAAVTAAVSDDGHVLMRAHYAVRNDRGHVLRITPPPGLEPVGVRVAGEAVTVAREGETWLVPLRKSVESVQGLLSFGVEVTFLGTDAAWTRRERREVPLPTVNAEVAVTRVTLHLPPGWRHRGRSGEHEVVDAFTEGGGITYGFAVGDARAAQADALFQEAVGAWMDNDFDEAQQKLDALKSLGADNQDIEGLQGNLFVVEDGKDVSGAETALERRVLDQARARSEDERREQQEVLFEAEEATRRGDYEQANEAYGQALELADKLGKLANTEDVAQEELQAKVREKVSENVDRKSKRDAFEPNPVEAPPPPQSVASATSPVTSAAVGDLRVTVLDDVGLPIPGATVTVEGESIGARTLSADTNGEVLAVDLPPGRYRATLQGEGFGDTTLEGVQVDANRESRQAVALRSSDIEEIVVEASQPAIDTTSTSRSQVLSKEFLNSVPSGRSYQSSVTLERGVTGGAGGNPNMAGGASSENTYLLDGENLTDPVSGTLEQAPVPEGRTGKSEAKKDEAPARASAASLDLSMGSADAPLAVTATHASVVVPSQGEAVLYQHLLLPAGADLVVRVDARRSRRNP